MTPNRRGLKYGWLGMFVGLAVWGTLCAPTAALAQRWDRQTIRPGTTLVVRTTEPINTNSIDGREFPGVLDQEVRDATGDVAIPRGTPVYLLVRRISNDEVALDVDSVTVNGQWYEVSTEANAVEATSPGNGHVGETAAGGALLGAVIGAIAGGGKGAAIGAGAGAGAGVAAGILTQGRRIDVPAETVLTFTLQQPLRLASANDRVFREGHYYRQSAFPEGRGGPFLSIEPDNDVNWQGPPSARIFVQVDNARPRVFASGPSGKQRADWIEPGHVYMFTMRDGDGREIARQQVDTRQAGGYGMREPRPFINIEPDNDVNWQGPPRARVFIQVDNAVPRLFASGPSGKQKAMGIEPGHVYTFIMRDAGGREITRQEVDTRQGPGYRQPGGYDNDNGRYNGR